MNFLEQIKEKLDSPRNRAGMRDQVTVNTRALRELIHHFERLDSDARSEHYRLAGAPPEQQLSEIIKTVYHKQGRNSEITLLIIMDTLTPLIEAKRKEIPEYRG